MKLQLAGHEDRYAVEQLQMALFDLSREGEAVSALHRGKTWLTAVTTITCDGKTTRGVRRLKAEQETVRPSFSLRMMRSRSTATVSSTGCASFS